jgi:hypothetical protein
MQAAKVEKIVLDVLGTKLELTPDQARELRDVLVSVLGPKQQDAASLAWFRELGKTSTPNPWPSPLSPFRHWEPAPAFPGRADEVTCKVEG